MENFPYNFVSEIGQNDFPKDIYQKKKKDAKPNFYDFSVGYQCRFWSPRLPNTVVRILL